MLVVMYLIIWFTTRNEARQNKWQIFYVTLGIVSGLIWTYVLVGILIDFLNVLGVMLALDPTFLGLTVLAIGNALPDTFTTIAMLQKGDNIVLALSGGYAGQLFGLLIGFGLSMLKTTLAMGPRKFDLYDPSQISTNILDIVVMCVALMALLTTFFWGVCNKFTMTKKFAIIIAAQYGIFFVGCSIFAFIKAYQSY
jgi:Ca2+/Na+ antiporter